MSGRLVAADLIGTWLLSTWQIHVGAQTHHPFGDRPQGLLVYTAEGWMQACIAAPDRPQLSDPSPRRAAAEELAEAFRSYFSYAGPYDVAENTVVHHVQLSLNPAMVGTDQVRFVELSEPLLVLSATEGAGADAREHVLSWRRAEGVG